MNHKGKQEDQEPSVFIASFNTPYVCFIQQMKWYCPAWFIKCIAVCIYHLISLSVVWVCRNVAGVFSSWLTG